MHIGWRTFILQVFSFIITSQSRHVRNKIAPNHALMLIFTCSEFLHVRKFFDCQNTAEVRPLFNSFASIAWFVIRQWNLNDQNQLSCRKRNWNVSMKTIILPTCFPPLLIWAMSKQPPPSELRMACPAQESHLYVWPLLVAYMSTQPLATHRSLYPAPAAFFTSKPLASSAPSTKACGSVELTTAELPSLTDACGDDDDGASVDEV